ncbi:hypothetical protein M0804_002347 [Polistes exclamans]|nr:hypothetical protein M0804_002347 [Polistes exclamans]
MKNLIIRVSHGEIEFKRHQMWNVKEEGKVEEESYAYCILQERMNVSSEHDSLRNNFVVSGRSPVQSPIYEPSKMTSTSPVNIRRHRRQPKTAFHAHRQTLRENDDSLFFCLSTNYDAAAPI